MDENILNKFNSYEDCKDAIKLISDAMDNGKLVFLLVLECRYHRDIIIGMII